MLWIKLFKLLDSTKMKKWNYPEEEKLNNKKMPERNSSKEILKISQMKILLIHPKNPLNGKVFLHKEFILRKKLKMFKSLPKNLIVYLMTKLNNLFLTQSIDQWTTKKLNP